MQNKGYDETTLSISQVAERLNISVETIRLYERRGLVLTSKTEGNQRIFSESDVERIECIRNAINEKKISIEGIRRMQSLIPCWKIVKCPGEQRDNCPAYVRTDAGCWTYADKQKACLDRDCRSCKIYKLSGDCEQIKTLIYDNKSKKAKHSAD